MDTLKQHHQQRGFVQVLFLLVLAVVAAFSASAVEITLVTGGSQVGGPFDIDVFVSDGIDFHGCGFDVVYDPALLGLIDADDQTAGLQPKITEAPLLSENGGVLTALLGALEDGVDGRLVVGIARKGAGLAGLNIISPTLLMTLHMEGVSAGSTTIGLENSISQDAIGTRLTIAPTADLQLEVVDNSRPVLDPIGPQNVNENEQLTFTVSGSDPDAGDTLTFSATGLPAGASFTPATRVFDWTPGSDAAGMYDVEFSVEDNGTPPLSDTETVTITVLGINSVPVFDAIAPQSVTEGNTLSFTVSATDDDNDPLTYDVETLPGTASFTPASQTFTWDTEIGDAGVYTVTFTATDPFAAFDEITVSITVNEYPATNPCDDLADASALMADLRAFLGVDSANDDMDGDGLPDEVVLAIMNYILCEANASELGTATDNAFTINFNALINETQFASMRDHDAILRILLAMSSEMQTAVIDLLELLGITPLDGEYQTVACTDPNSCTPKSIPGVKLSEAYEVFDKSVGEPYSAEGDIDGDGKTNLVEFNAFELDGGDWTDPDQLAKLIASIVKPPATGDTPRNRKTGCNGYGPDAGTTSGIFLYAALTMLLLIRARQRRN